MKMKKIGKYGQIFNLYSLHNIDSLESIFTINPRGLKVYIYSEPPERIGTFYIYKAKLLDHRRFLNEGIIHLEINNRIMEFATSTEHLKYYLDGWDLKATTVKDPTKSSSLILSNSIDTKPKYKWNVSIELTPEEREELNQWMASRELDYIDNLKI